MDQVLYFLFLYSHNHLHVSLFSKYKTAPKVFFVFLIACIIKYLHHLLLYHTIFSSSISTPFTHIHCPFLHLSGLFSPLHWFHQRIIDSVRWWGRCIWVSSVPSIRIRKDQSAVSHCPGFPWAAGSHLLCFLSFYCIWASDMTYRQSIHANMCLKGLSRQLNTTHD